MYRIYIECSNYLLPLAFDMMTTVITLKGLTCQAKQFTSICN